MTSSLPQPFNEVAWQEQIRRRELIRYAACLCELAKKVRMSEDFATDTPQKLADLITGIAHILGECIPTAPVRILKEISDFLSLIATHLRYVERAKVAQTPWSIIEGAEHFLKQQAGPKTNFIIRPTWAYNYSLVGEFWECYKEILSGWSWFPLDRLKANIPIEDEEKIYCISFPRTETQNCLLHANWGHEVGHIIAARWIESQFESLWMSAQPKIKQRIKERVSQNPPPLDTLFQDMYIDELVSQQTRAAMDAARCGITELICDAVGVHILGPSAVAAAVDYAVRFAIDTSPLQCGFYPPWRYRLRKMLEYCKEDLEDRSSNGYPTPTIRPFVEWLRQAKELTAVSNDVQIIESNIVTLEAYRFIGENWDPIHSQSISMLPPVSAKPYRLYERGKGIDTLVDRLQKGIPPNEAESLSNSPASFEDIISAGWIFKMERVSKDTNWGKAEDFDLLFRLVLKACESSQVHAVWGSQIPKDES